jgi:KUP system potassium uptake protein
MTADPQGVPRALLHNLNHNKVLHERVVLLNMASDDVPHVPEGERVRVEALPEGFYRVFARYGFKDDPNVPRVMEECADAGALLRDDGDLVLPRARNHRHHAAIARGGRMAHWRQILFTWMLRNADSATAYFKIPPNRVVELGAQVELT